MKRLRNRADAVGLRLGRPIPRRMPSLLLLFGLVLGSVAFAQGGGPAPAQLSSTCMSGPEPQSLSEELDALAKATPRRAPIAQETLDRWLGHCSFDEAKEKLSAAGFQVGEYKELSNSARNEGIARIADGEKGMALYPDPDPRSKWYGQPIAALIARVMLHQHTDGHLKTTGFFYIDAP